MTDESSRQGWIATGRFHDGITAAVVAVDLVLDSDVLLIEGQDGRSWRWRLADLRRVPDEDARIALRLTSIAQPEARVTLSDPTLLLERLRTLCLDLDPLDGGGIRLRHVAGTMIGFALLIGVYFGVPLLARALAPVIPQSWQQGVGMRVEADLAAALSRSKEGGRLCSAPTGSAAMTALVSPLAHAAGLAAPHVTVIDAALVNAFALPGDRIVVTRGMIDFAADANELAGILAHELGHLRYGDPISGLLARFEWNAVTSLIFGNMSFANFGETIVLLSYSRSVEARADEEGVVILRAAGIDSGGFAAVMTRIGSSEPAAVSYLKSHPATPDRVATIERLGMSGAPALDPARWAEIKGICTTLRPFSVS